MKEENMSIKKDEVRLAQEKDEEIIITLNMSCF